jgi:hypothetical protein
MLRKLACGTLLGATQVNVRVDTAIMLEALAGSTENIYVAAIGLLRSG